MKPGGSSAVLQVSFPSDPSMEPDVSTARKIASDTIEAGVKIESTSGNNVDDNNSDREGIKSYAPRKKVVKKVIKVVRKTTQSKNSLSSFKTEDGQTNKEDAKEEVNVGARKENNSLFAESSFKVKRYNIDLEKPPEDEIEENPNAVLRGDEMEVRIGLETEIRLKDASCSGDHLCSELPKLEEGERESEVPEGGLNHKERNDCVDLDDRERDACCEKLDEGPPKDGLEEEQKQLAVVAEERNRKKEFEIFVGGLDREATEEDIRNAFNNMGEVVEIRLHKDPLTSRNKGYAFVKFSSKDHVKRTLSEMRNPVIRGKRCGTAPSEDNDTLFLGNICNTWTKEAIHQRLKDYTIEGVENITLVPDVQHEGRSRGFAFIEFSSHFDAMSAYKRLQKPDAIFGHLERTAKVAFAEPIREPDPQVMSQVTSVFLDGIHPQWDEAQVRKRLNPFGEIKGVVLSRNMPTAKRKDFGFVDFTTHEAAITCIQNLNQRDICEGISKIRIKARLSNPLPKTQAVKGGMCGGFRINAPHYRNGREFYQRRSCHIRDGHRRLDEVPYDRVGYIPSDCFSHEGSRGIKRPFYFPEHQADFAEPVRVRPRFDHFDLSRRRYYDYGRGGDGYSRDHYGFDYMRDPFYGGRYYGRGYHH